jgi:hypothetical protein
MTRRLSQREFDRRNAISEAEGKRTAQIAVDRRRHELGHNQMFLLQIGVN